MILLNLNNLFADSKVVTSIAIEHKLFELAHVIDLHTVKWFQVLLCNTNNSI